MVTGTLAWTQLVIAIIALSPFIYYKWQVGRWISNCEFPKFPDDTNHPMMTLILPVWNEAKIIEKKLDDLAGQEYPRKLLQLLIIDSASDDNTVELIEKWIKSNPKSFPIHKLIVMGERLGKSAAINLAIDSADEKSKVIAMTDADAFLEVGSLERLGIWFNNDSIGAVGATPLRTGINDISHIQRESIYRNLFTLQRIGESKIDSTPFLEGSLAGYRKTSIGKFRVVENANADDAQLAVAVRKSGFKVIQDPEILFRELTPSSPISRRKRKVRRAQGLSRHLWRNREMWFSKRYDKFGKIIGIQGLLHLLIPWLILIGILIAFSKWIMWIIIGGEWNTITIIIAFADIVTLTSWIGLRFSKSIPGLGLSQTFLDSMESLLIAHWTTLKGESLHMWNQIEDVRNQILED